MYPPTHIANISSVYIDWWSSVNIDIINICQYWDHQSILTDDINIIGCWQLPLISTAMFRRPLKGCICVICGAWLNYMGTWLWHRSPFYSHSKHRWSVLISSVHFDWWHQCHIDCWWWYQYHIDWWYQYHRLSAISVSQYWLRIFHQSILTEEISSVNIADNWRASY